MKWVGRERKEEEQILKGEGNLQVGGKEGRECVGRGGKFKRWED